MCHSCKQLQKVAKLKILFIPGTSCAVHPKLDQSLCIQTRTPILMPHALESPTTWKHRLIFPCSLSLSNRAQYTCLTLLKATGIVIPNHKVF